MDVQRNPTADRVAAQATGVGVGFIALMIAWLIAARLTERIWGRPSAAYVALAAALLIGTGVSGWAVRRFVRVTVREATAQPQAPITPEEAQQV
jgi:hypothetical protein